MTVMERSGSRDQFPVGMRVLAVDDDPTCLKVLETLLLRCQYHVTTTNQAIKALKMLRENKDQFDLVISDVHMPDMDGFKLLELVGLEMDLPVIMLSANGETQAVMKGITHGACDYLIKPVRLEELKNIWQHVIRRKRFDPRDNLDSGDDCDKAQIANSDGAQGSLANGSFDRNLKLNRKRKDQNEEDEEDGDGDDNLHDNEDTSTQKKPRVVWSVELHRKFVAAVNQLGIDKAVPKRILDLMNVERLTRENVASHLQKYRLYLKRLSAVANQQANMVAVLKGRDPSSYLPMGSLDSYANFNSLVGSRPLPTRTPFQSNGALPRMNSFTGFGLQGFVPSGSAPLARTLNNTSNPVNDVGKLQGIGLPTLQGNQQGTSLIQGMPANLELDKLQQPKAIQEASNRLLNGFSANSFTSATKSPHIVHMHQQQTQSAGLSSESSIKIPSLSSDHFEIGIGDSSHAVDLSRCTDSWQCAIPSTSCPANTLPMSLPFNHNGLSSSNMGENFSSMQNDALANVQNRNANILNFGTLSNSQNPSLVYSSSSNSSMPISGVSNKTMDFSIIGQTSFGAPYIAQESKTASLSEDLKLPGGFGSGGSGLDDIVGNAIIKPECDDLSFLDGDIGCNDIFSLGACI